jgi:hypothetical protein
VADAMAQAGHDSARATLEGVAIEGSRTGALTASQTRRMLGLSTRYQLDGFLKSHNVMERAYSLEDLQEDRKTIAFLEQKRKAHVGSGGSR